MPAYNDHNTFDVDSYNRNYLNDPSLQTITAIKNNALITPREGYLYNVSQDIVFGVQEIARCTYGNAFDFPDNMHLSVSGEKNQ
jgi:iron complex transport system substrate-binding protein